MGKKATHAEVERRTEIVLRMLIECKRSSEIAAFAKEEWGITRQTTDTYITRARKLLREDYAIERADFIANKLGVLDKVTKLAMDSGQLNAVIGSLRLQADMIGAYPDKGGR